MSRTAKKPASLKFVPKKPKVLIIKSDAKAPALPAKHTKQGILLSVLKREEGATMEELIKATGWQAHSIRGALSGVIKKRLELTVARAKEERGIVYRITA